MHFINPSIFLPFNLVLKATCIKQSPVFKDQFVRSYQSVTSEY